MADTNNKSQWDAPKFSFRTGNEAEEWKTYVRALDYLETLDMNIDATDQTKCGKYSYNKKCHFTDL